MSMIQGQTLAAGFVLAPFLTTLIRIFI